jgi:hypothetical protein
VDLDAVDGGTRMRLRWEYRGEPALEPATKRRIRTEKEAAFGRLTTVLADPIPVVGQRDVAS